MFDKKNHSLKSRTHLRNRQHFLHHTKCLICPNKSVIRTHLLHICCATNFKQMVMFHWRMVYSITSEWLFIYDVAIIFEMQSNRFEHWKQTIFMSQFNFPLAIWWNNAGNELICVLHTHEHICVTCSYSIQKAYNELYCSGMYDMQVSVILRESGARPTKTHEHTRIDDIMSQPTECGPIQPIQKSQNMRVCCSFSK